MIVACESYFTDDGHAPFNAGLLATIRAAFPDEELFFFGAGAHIEELKQQLGVSLSASISWIEIVPPGPERGYFGRLLSEITILRKLFRTFPQNSRGQLLLASACPSTIVALKLVKHLQFDIKAQVVLHGGLTGILGRRYRRPILRFQEMRTALTLFGNSNIQYLVLEDCIRDALLKNVPSLSGKVETLEHPLPPNEAASTSTDFNTPIRFGFLGLANEQKGFVGFLQLAKEMAAKYPDQVEFHAIGRLPADEENSTPELDALATKPGVRRMSRADFIEGVKRLHFIIFSHHPGHYDLSPSGTLLDAIAWEKPLVARSLPIFEDMLTKHGDIGYLFRNDMELREIVEHIIQKLDNLHYYRQVLNIRKARTSRAPKALAVSYREICRALAPQDRLFALR
jgi:hypothetical protein